MFGGVYEVLFISSNNNDNDYERGYWEFYLIDITQHFCVDEKAITGAKIYLVSQSGTCH